MQLKEGRMVSAVVVRRTLSLCGAHARQDARFISNKKELWTTKYAKLEIRISENC